MRVNYQIAIDCSDPHLLARFWSEALQWKLEEHEDQIKQLLAQGVATDDDVTTVDGRLVWKTAAAVRDEQAPERGRLLFHKSRIGASRPADRRRRPRRRGGAADFPWRD